MPDNTFDVLCFDLGGVLVELGGVRQMMAWLDGRLTEADLWERWLSSKTVRVFESGNSTPIRFASEMVATFNLPVTTEEFLSKFENWVKKPFDGASQLLASLSKRYALALLSNTNGLHWRRIEKEMGIVSYFDWVLPSHLTGRLKPDKEAYLHLIDVTGCRADRMIFFDDNEMNVSAANKVGITSYQVTGVSGVRRVVEMRGLLSQPQ